MKKEYFSFEGRLNRKKYFLRTLLVSLIYSIIMGVSMSVLIGGGLYGNSSGLALLGTLLLIASSVVGTVMLFSFAVRRAHDLNHSGWYVLLGILIYPYVQFLFQKGTVGDNRYGPDPLQQVEKV